jgi:hypothetical protein
MSIRVADWWAESGEQELRDLLNEWDPIGVMRMDTDWPPDEYDPYLSPVFTTLREGGGIEEVRQTLARALGRMGLGQAGARQDEFAARIIAWWRQSFPGN